MCLIRLGLGLGVGLGLGLANPNPNPNHPKGQPDVPEHRGERVARFVLKLGVPLPLKNRKEERAYYPAAARAVLSGVLVRVRVRV